MVRVSPSLGNLSPGIPDLDISYLGTPSQGNPGLGTPGLRNPGLRTPGLG